MCIIIGVFFLSFLLFDFDFIWSHQEQTHTCLQYMLVWFFEWEIKFSHSRNQMGSSVWYGTCANETAYPIKNNDNTHIHSIVTWSTLFCHHMLVFWTFVASPFVHEREGEIEQKIRIHTALFVQPIDKKLITKSKEINFCRINNWIYKDKIMKNRKHSVVNIKSIHHTYPKRNDKHQSFSAQHGGEWCVKKS